MCKTQCLLAVFALSVGLVNSWDIAITTGDQLEFYSNETKTNAEGGRFRDLTALAYDAVHNMLLFVDRQNDNASIFSYHLATKKYQALVRRRSYENIQGLAFDPVKSLLFWTDNNERSIFWISLKPGYKNGAYGNQLIKMDDEIPRAIAVDSCRGYVYWTNINVNKPTIERVKFDGSDRKIVVDTDLFRPISIAIDQKSRKLYWADDKEGIHYSIESSDLDGKDRKTLLAGTSHQPNTLAVSKDSLYWVDWGYKSVWKLAKDAPVNTKPTELIHFSNEVPFGVVASYNISDQIEGIPECAALKSLSQNKSAVIDSFNIPKDIGLFCLHGVKVDGKLACNCSSGYTGERCEMSVCQNFCLEGDCSFSNDGKPMCRCKTGYSGARCEVNVCNGYCLNNGVCSFNGQMPSCQCLTDYKGDRCENLEVLTSTTNSPASAVPPVPIAVVCNSTKEHLASPREVAYQPESVSIEGEFVTPIECDQGWDSVRDPVITVLGVLCGMLCLACTILVTRVMQLKKRPSIEASPSNRSRRNSSAAAALISIPQQFTLRIKKRIIVNKNVTPMTARPDQCEITIENCCNMNICETPCFEPRSTIRPSLGDSKPGKEEKKNLIANMEYPEDY